MKEFNDMNEVNKWLKANPDYNITSIRESNGKILARPTKIKKNFW